MKRWQFWLGILISILFLYFALRGLQLGAIWETLKAANYWWLIPGIAVYFMAVWVRAWRWHYLLRPLKKIPTRTMFPIVAIGYMGNNIYPARAGEILRAVVLKMKEGVAISSSLATIIIERVFDGVVMLAFVFFNLPELATLTSSSGFVGRIQTLAFWGAIAFIGALAIFLLAAMFPSHSSRIVDRFIAHLLPLRWRETSSSLSHRFLSGLEALRSPRDSLMIFFTSVVIWLLETGLYWLILQIFLIRDVSFFGLMLMNGIANLVTTIPSAPGYIGTFDAAIIALLKAYSIPGAVAASYTLVLHGALWLPITLVGAYFFMREGLTLTKAMESAKKEQESKS